MNKNNSHRKLVAVTFADIQGYTALTRRDEAKALQAVEKFKQIVNKIVARHNGEIVQYYGDGVLTIHQSAVDAVNCAIDMQTSFQLDPPIPVRMGIHLGDVVISDHNIYGDAVNMASRLESLGTEASILISNEIANEIKNHPDLRSTHISDEYVKNVKNKIGVHAIQAPGLRIPSAESVHQKSHKAANRANVMKRVVLPLLFLLVLIMGYTIIQYPDMFQSKSALGDKLDISVLCVMPFSIHSSDAAQQNLGLQAAHRIISIVNYSEKIKIVEYQNVQEIQDFGKFSMIDVINFQEKTLASHAIHGDIYVKNDSLVMDARLIDLKDNEVKHYFKAETCHKNESLRGIDRLAEQILVYLAVQESNISFLSYPTLEAYEHVIVAWEYYNENNLEEAYNSFSKSIEEDSTFLDPYFAILDLLYAQEAFCSASDFLKLIQTLFPREKLNPRQRNMLKYDEALIRGDGKQAFQYLQKDLKEYKPYDLGNSTDLANHSKLLINNPQKAMEIIASPPLDKIPYAENPYYSYRLNVALWALVKTEQYEKAQEIIDYFPQDIRRRDIYETQLLLYTKLNDTVAIDQVLSKANYSKLNYSPKYLYYWVANLFELQDKEALKGKYIQEALASFMQDSSYYYMIGSLYFLDGNYEKSLRFHQDLLEKFPKYQYAHFMEGASHAKLGNSEEARAIAENLPEFQKECDRGGTYYQQAVIYNLLGDEEKAKSLIAKSLNKGKFFSYLAFDFDPKLKNLLNDSQYMELIHPEVL